VGEKDEFINFRFNSGLSGGVARLRINIRMTHRVGSLEYPSIGFRVSLM
jgi:hypothetical protein